LLDTIGGKDADTPPISTPTLVIRASTGPCAPR
jgi:hypothetical protein